MDGTSLGQEQYQCGLIQFFYVLHSHGTSGMDQVDFGDPDHERTAASQLHALNMMTGMMANEYMSKF